MPALHFLAPVFLLGALAVAIPVILHLLRRRQGAPVALPSLYFFKPLQPSRSRQTWQRWLVLLLRCAAILLLVAAFVRPFWGQRGQGGQAMVIVVDRSFSLQAGERWEGLQRWLAGELRQLDKSASVGVLAMQDQPVWLLPMTRDRQALERTLRGLKPGWGSSQVEPGLRFAADFLELSGASEKRILVASDQQQLAWSGTNLQRKLPYGVKLQLAPLAAAVESQWAVSAAKVSTGGRGVLRAQALVRSYSRSEQTRMLRVFGENDAQPLAQESLTLAPGEERTLELTFPSVRDARWLRFVLDADVLPADDTAYALVGDASTAETKVFLDQKPTAGGPDFVRIAFDSLSARPPGFRVQMLNRTLWPKGGVAVLRNELSFAEEGRQVDAFLEAGGRGLVFLNPQICASSWWAKHGLKPAPLPARAEPWRVHDWMLEHPLVNPLAEYNLRNVLSWTFSAGWSFSKSALEPIALWGDDSVAIGDLRLGEGRLLICGFPSDRSAGDWTIDEAFLPFLDSALRVLSDTSSDAGRDDVVRVGDLVAFPPGSGNWHCLGGPGRGSSLLSVEGSIRPEFPGVYAFEQGGRQTLYAVGLSAEESDLKLTSEYSSLRQLEQTGSKTAANKRSEQRSFRPEFETEAANDFWWWCLAALLVCLLTELTIANRSMR